jgi:hypothetical protein
MNSATESPPSHGTSGRQQQLTQVLGRDASPPEQGQQPQVEHVEVAAPTARSVIETIEPAAQSVPQTAEVEEAPAGLSWTAFGELYFPGRRRHDFDVLRAFAKYVAAEK